PSLWCLLKGLGGVVQGRRETPGSPRLLREVGIGHSARKRPGRPPCRATDVLKRRVLARCPNCRNTFSTDRSGRQDCPVCGKPLVVPEQPAGTAAPPPPTEAPPAEAVGTPWERRRQLGFIPAWAQTVQQALFEPGRLLGSAQLD